ncbi:PhzF family phenazine biosynthesis protein [Streptomyces qinglanensis]|uniref:PhzF family phenazine biosynthesis protein n=1 Tax=Streptomyces qinglanensis TaxID=943816 RepID=UPI003D731DEF
MVTCVLARAFVNGDGEFGNPALVVLEPGGVRLDGARRQALADELGVPATVFVPAAGSGSGRREVRIHGSYGQAIRFGGHPLLATTEVLHRLGSPVSELAPEAGTVGCRRDERGTVWLTAPAAWSKPWRHYEMGSPAEIEALTELPPGEDFTQVWAWADREAGRIRARLWAPRIGKGEDEACGSASMLLALKLGRPLEVLHGRHRAAILVRPLDESRVELGGRCVLDEAGPEVTTRVQAAYAGA